MERLHLIPPDPDAVAEAQAIAALEALERKRQGKKPQNKSINTRTQPMTTYSCPKCGGVALLCECGNELSLEEKARITVEIQSRFRDVAHAWTEFVEKSVKHSLFTYAALEYLKKYAPRDIGKTVCAMTGEAEGCNQCVWDCPFANLGPAVK